MLCVCGVFFLFVFLQNHFRFFTDIQPNIGNILQIVPHASFPTSKAAILVFLRLLQRMGLVINLHTFPVQLLAKRMSIVHLE